MTKAKFTVTGKYGCQPKGEDDVYTVQEFTELCNAGAFVDDDGDGQPVLADKTIMDDIYIMPSTIDQIPPEATHIIWYNK